MAASDLFHKRHTDELVGGRTSLLVETPIKVRWDQGLLRSLVAADVKGIPSYVKTTLTVPAAVYRSLAIEEKRTLDPAAQPYHAKASVEVLLRVQGPADEGAGGLRGGDEGAALRTPRLRQDVPVPVLQGTPRVKRYVATDEVNGWHAKVRDPLGRLKPFEPVSDITELLERMSAPAST